MADQHIKHFADHWKRFDPKSPKAKRDRLRYKIYVRNEDDVDVDEETVRKLVGVAYRETKYRYKNETLPMAKIPEWTLTKSPDGILRLIAPDAGKSRSFRVDIETRASH
jgi:hypothetical protein